MPAEGFELYLSSALRRRPPKELHLVLRGLVRKHVSAFWNGLPWVM